MSHEVEQMFSVKETPWHGLGHVVRNAPTIEDVLKLAGLDWTVSMQPLYLGENYQNKAVTEKAIVRDSDQSVLGFAGPHYKPLQNNEALDFFKPFHDSKEAIFETAGSLRSGRKIWILAAINRSEIEVVKGDTVKKFLLLSNGHDGKTGVRIGFTPIRVVCANTLAVAHTNENSKLMRIFHSKKVKENLDLIRDTVNIANEAFEATAEQYKLLAARNVHKGDLEKFVSKVFYNNKQAESDREKIARENLNQEILKLFETGHGAEIPGVRGTYWGLYNATTEYLGYIRGRDQDTRLDNLWFGTSKNLNDKAFETALVMSAA